MHGDDAAAQIVIARLDEPGGAQHLEQGFLIRMHADRFREIAIAVRVLGDESAEQRQDLEGVGVVNRLQARRHRRRKLQHQQLTARFQHAVHGAERRRLVGDIAQAEADGDAVEGIVLERQRSRIGNDALDIAHESRIEQAVAADFQHRRIDIRQHHPARICRLGAAVPPPDRRCRRRHPGRV